jgi:hypothetical protein
MSDLPAGSDITKVIVFNSENKLVTYLGTFGVGVREIVSQWGRIFVLENNGRVRFSFLCRYFDIPWLNMMYWFLVFSQIQRICICCIVNRYTSLR